MKVDIAIFYQGTVTGTRDERLAFLKDRFNEISPVLQQHNVSLNPDSLSTLGQIMGGAMEDSEMDPLKAKLARTSFRLLPDLPTQIIG